MKKIILLSIVLPVLSFGQALVFSNQTITVQPDQLSVESVEYHAAEVVTNTVFQWLETEAVYTNGLFQGSEIVTNTVGQQVGEEIITTNSAHWTCSIIFNLPKGHQWRLNGFPITIDRFKARLEIPVDPQLFRTMLESYGAPRELADGLEYAAQNGAYTPTGQIKEIFLKLAYALLEACQ